MDKNTDIKRLIAEDLLRIKAVFLRPEDPFTWASGIKSPIYCDNRLTLTAPDVRTDVEEALAFTIGEKFPEAEVLMGTATAGIAHAAITAHLMGLPMGYVRSGAKDHGRGNQIEGRLEPGQKVVVVEDLISTGGSCIDTVNVLRDAGAEVLGVISIMTYGMKDNVSSGNWSNSRHCVHSAGERQYRSQKVFQIPVYYSGAQFYGGVALPRRFYLI